VLLTKGFSAIISGVFLGRLSIKDKLDDKISIRIVVRPCPFFHKSFL
jgi:hypothetical protein